MRFLHDYRYYRCRKIERLLTVSMEISTAPDIRAFEKTARKKGFTAIAGVDEVGRGPLAGPVVSAAVILPAAFPESGITDSKKLSPRKREALYSHICDHALSIGIGIIDAAEIDRLNILQASLLSMAVAVKNLHIQPNHLLIDGIFPIAIDLPQQTIIKGDSLSISIASASIVAKVIRDRLMEKYHQQYPSFAFDQHKGYPTKAHKEAIQKHGSCPIHRKTFKGVKEHVKTV